MKIIGYWKGKSNKEECPVEKIIIVESICCLELWLRYPWIFWPDGKLGFPL